MPPIQKIIKMKTLPERLAHIPDPPKELYRCGSLEETSGTKYLCVVGSRNHTQYGAACCKKLISGLSGYPITIVSGMALGIDTIAHTEALAAGLTTIAFPGSGLASNTLYPKSNHQLAERICGSGGALVSELPPKTRAANWTFPRRNRLMAGFSDAILVIEAEKKSGTLITAYLALEYNRDVFAVPGSLVSPHSYGTHTLIRKGALLVRSSHDILDAFGFTITKERSRLSIPESCTDSEKLLLHHLVQPLSRTELIEKTSLSATEISIAISTLEIKGLITEHMGVIERTL